MNKRAVRRIFFALVYTCLVALACLAAVEFIGQRVEVEGMSMYPTLEDGEHLILDKLTYRLRPPKRYEIVVFPPKYRENTYYIKRIIGLPGEKVSIVEGEVWIDDEPLKEDFGFDKMQWAGLAETAFYLGEDEYFVLGDNRNDSLDSREPQVGSIKQEDIIGRAFLRIWPLSRFCLIRHT